MNNSLDIKIQKTENSRLKDFDPSNLKFGHTFSDHIFVADYKDGEWSDLRIVPFDDFSISPANSALHYGQSIFEGMKAFKNKDEEILLFRPEMNAKRFNNSAERMCMAQVPEELFMKAIKELLKVDEEWIPDTPGSSMYIRPFMFATDNFLGVRPSETYKFVVINSPSGPYYADPVRVKIETEFTRAAKGGTGSAKTAGNYAGSLYPAQQAKKEGFDQLIWTDGATHSFVEEAGTMNVMFLIDGKLRTTPLTSTILPGVTRDSVLQLAKHWDVPVEEAPVKVDEVIKAAKEGRLQDAFGVGTAATIAHIKEIGFEDQLYTLPNVEKREFSSRLRDYLEDVKRGKIEDEHNWITKF
jgi:branched-chain amino acid aminotransferase